MKEEQLKAIIDSGKEEYIERYSFRFGSCDGFILYSFETKDGDIFEFSGKSLEHCRAERDKWLHKRSVDYAYELINMLHKLKTEFHLNNEEATKVYTYIEQLKEERTKHERKTIYSV